MFAFLRWIAFLPVAFLAAVVVGAGMYWAGWFISEFYGYVLSGARGAADFVAMGLL
jgi:hypothetical protein